MTRKLPNFVQVGDNYLTIPKGSKIEICNPKEDGDIPATQYDLVVETTEDICVYQVGGKSKFKVLGKKERE